MLEFRNLDAGYGGKPVLRDVRLTLRGGEVTVIGGLNGCGKSTLLKTACALLPPRKGSVLVEGVPLDALSPRQRALRMAYMPQSRSVPGLTALRMVLHGRFAHLSFPRQYRREDLEAARNALEWVGCGDLAERDMASLSGGQRQKVYLAMALAQDTGIILMDEPTAYLDIKARFEVMALARRLAEGGKAVVMVLHDLDLMLRCAHRIVLLAEGGVAADGEAEQLWREGCLERVFGVSAERVLLPGGAHYFFSPRPDAGGGCLDR